MHPDVVYTIPLHALQQKEDTILTIHDNHTLIATIRYHFIGTYESTPIHLVDCFCVHPLWRGKGVGDYLLHELHHMMQSTPCALFLKEG
jgi:GNAT superfamily N-acetyltransferase